ncbi:MAG TPA: thiamine phosphate synthase [Pyrinomonadaceae bacterium]
MKISLPKIYPITDRRLSGLSHAEQTRAFIEGGATLIQLREKSTDMRAFYDDVVNALALAREHRGTLLINDRVDIAMVTHADGVHLGQDDLPPAEARKLLGANAIIGLSTHNIEQFGDALKEPIDYIAVGPIFSTSTKDNPDPVVGVDFLIEAKRIAGDMPMVAIGGINAANVASVLAAGADSAAMISELYRSGEIASHYRELSDLAG